MRSTRKQAEDMAKDILDDPKYATSLKARALAGQLPIAIEQMLWHYRFGKPPDKIQIEDLRAELRDKSNEELVQHLEAVRKRALNLVVGNKVAEEVTDLILEEEQRTERPVAHFADYSAKAAG